MSGSGASNSYRMTAPLPSLDFSASQSADFPRRKRREGWPGTTLMVLLEKEEPLVGRPVPQRRHERLAITLKRVPPQRVAKQSLCTGRVRPLDGGVILLQRNSRILPGYGGTEFWLGEEITGADLSAVLRSVRRPQPVTQPTVGISVLSTWRHSQRPFEESYSEPALYRQDRRGHLKWTVCLTSPRPLRKSQW